MDPLHKKLKEELANLRLEPEEKAILRMQLREAMAAHPARGSYVSSPYASFFVLHRVLAFGALLLLVLVGGGGGVAYAAQGALPGDALYPIKIHVTENVESALALSPTAKAEVQAELAGRRLEEAQTLAAAGRLDATTTAQLAANFDAHAQEVQTLAHDIADADPSSAAQLSAQLSSSLSVQGSVLAHLGDASTDEHTRTDSQALSKVVHKHAAALALSVEGLLSASTTPAGGANEDKGQKDQRTTAGLASTTVESTSTAPATATASAAASSTRTTEALLGLEAQAQAQYAQAQQALAKERGALDTQTAAQVDAQMTAIGALLEQGGASLSVGAGAEAALPLTQALRESVRLQALLSASKKFDKNIISPLLDTSGGDSNEGD